MKRMIVLLLTVVMIFSLAACGAGEKETDGDAATPPATDGSEALTDDAEKEDSEAVTPPKSDGSENLTDEDPNSGIPVPFVAEDFLYLCVELEHQILYGKAYANHAFVIRSCEDLTELLDEINTLIYGDDVFGEELQQKYTADYFEENGVTWQLCELGKIDAGGGGTVAKYMAERGIETIDAGTPVLSMHAPFEVTSKFDCYHTYLACKAILAL